MYETELLRRECVAMCLSTHWRLFMKLCFSLGSLLAVLVLAVIFATGPGCPGPKTPPAPPVVKGSDSKEAGNGADKDKEKKGGKGETPAVKSCGRVVQAKRVLQ